MGHRAAAALTESPHATPTSGLELPMGALHRAHDHDRTLEAVRRTAWDEVGIVRTGDGLRRAIVDLDVNTWHRSDAATVVRLIAEAALEREESRGAHYRSDFPDSNDRLQHRSFTVLEPQAMERLESDQLAAAG